MFLLFQFLWRINVSLFLWCINVLLLPRRINHLLCRWCKFPLKICEAQYGIEVDSCEQNLHFAQIKRSSVRTNVQTCVLSGSLLLACFPKCLRASVVSLRARAISLCARAQHRGESVRHSSMFPLKKILHWANACFGEHEYFKADLAEFYMIYMLRDLLGKV